MSDIPRRDDTPRRRREYTERSERRSSRRAAQKRKRVRRLFSTVTPVFVVIAVVVALLIVLGGRFGDDIVSASDPGDPGNEASQPARTAVLLGVESGDAIPALVLLVPSGSGGRALGLPGDLLINAGSYGFQKAADLLRAGQGEVLKAALDGDLGIELRGLATLPWSALREGLDAAGWPDALPEEPEGGKDGVLQAASIMSALVGLIGSSQGNQAWSGLEMTGEAFEVRDFVGTVAGMGGQGTWSASVIPGRTVAYEPGASYYEADMAAARVLLAGAAPAGAGVVTDGGEMVLEIQNGSGALEAAQTAGELLAPLGYNMLPFVNAEGFPDVRQTVVSAAPDYLSAAAEVQVLLGTGIVTEDATLEPGHIVVIVGKDFPPSG